MYGYQMNKRDSEIIADQLMQDGHIIVNDESVDDVVILNTCSVREQAEIKEIGKFVIYLELSGKTQILK